MSQWTVSSPHKLLISGAYTVLDGHTSLAIAVEPEMKLTLNAQSVDAWPRNNPFADAVREVILQEANAQGCDLPLGTLGFETHLELPVHGWGVGSSAAFTTALTHAMSLSVGLDCTQQKLFALARKAHRIAQNGQGSGLDIAACTFGGLVAAKDAHTDQAPTVQHFVWPREIGVLLIRSEKKADTRQMIHTYRQAPKEQAQCERDDLLASVERVYLAAQQGEGQGLLQALAENSRYETCWSQAMEIPLVTPLQQQLDQAFAPLQKDQSLVIKSLGAGGGDSIGCFYRKDLISLADIMTCLQPFTLQARPVQVMAKGVHQVEQTRSFGQLSVLATNVLASPTPSTSGA
ncbi:MAG: hypothetical protein H6727_15755 [Myxococcales bacterium]|nr:hypothetical protein [Myxococcales bacterium]